MKLTIEIDLERRRCFECGRYYMVEPQPLHCCPYCAIRRIDGYIDERNALQRSNSALRGAIRRKRGAK